MLRVSQIKSHNRTCLLKVLPWTVFFELSQPIKGLGWLRGTPGNLSEDFHVTGTEDGGLLWKGPSPQGLDLLLPQCSRKAGQVPATFLTE